MPGANDELARFEGLLRETHRIVYRVAYAVLTNTADAEEVAQDAFLRAYRNLSSLRDPAKFRAWVARASWRLALNRRRGQSRAAHRDTAWLTARPAMSDPESEAAGREFESRLQSNIAQLPDKLRSVILLSAVEELDTASIAAILKIPEGTVRSRLHLGRRQLMKLLWP